MRSIFLSISATPNVFCLNPIDLDVWLALAAGTAQSQKFTNEELLAAIGSTIGAHVDPDLHPYVEAVREMKSGHSGVTQEMLAHYLLQVGGASLALSQDVLADWIRMEAK